MTAHYTLDHVKEHAHIGMPITTSTDGESIAVPVGNLINQFSLGSKLVSTASYGGTNLDRCKAILESTFDNTGVFDLVKPMFVVDCLSHFLANSCKAVLIYVKYDCVRVDTEVIRKNMQLCIAWTKNHKSGQIIWKQRRIMLDFLVRGLLHLSKLVFTI